MTDLKQIIKELREDSILQNQHAIRKLVEFVEELENEAQPRLSAMENAWLRNGQEMSRAGAIRRVLGKSEVP